MGFYDKHILPHFINCACGTKPITYQRRKVVPMASGTILEVGIGTGLNLEHYDSAKVERLIGLDPSVASWEIAKKRATDISFPLEFIGLPGEEIPLQDNSVDTVMMTFSLCTIPDPLTALAGMRRVLKPGGKLIFAEHGRAPDADVRKWQDRIDPFWKVIAGGCHLNRDIPDLLGEGGFDITEMETMYLPSTPRFAGFNYWGVAEQM
jgi:ubiquinone/menaquinone biosynthesis C-methylase UbiE